MTALHDSGRGAQRHELAVEIFDRAVNRVFADLDTDLEPVVAAYDTAADPQLRAAYAALIATVHRQQLRYDTAGVWFARAHEAAPADTWASGMVLILEAGLHAWQGAIDEAGEAVDRAARCLPDDLMHLVYIQKAFLAIATDRPEDAETAAVQARQLADRYGLVDRSAIATLIEGRAQHLLGRPVDAETTFRSLLLRPDLPRQIRTLTVAWLGMNLASQGAMTAAIERFEETHTHFEMWPRGEMELAPFVATTYLEANLLDLANRSAARAVAVAIQLHESVVQATALMVQSRVDIARSDLDAARTRLAAALELLSSQDRPTLADEARRLLAVLDPTSLPDWLTVEDFCRDPSLCRALLVMADAVPEHGARYLEITARGLDAPDSGVRAMARYATILLQLSHAQFDVARAGVAELMRELIGRTSEIDALDVRAAGLELVDLRRIAVAFALAGHHDVLFETLQLKERSTFDFELSESTVAPALSRLEALRSSIASLPPDEVDEEERARLAHRIDELRRSRRASAAATSVGPARPPRIGFVAASGRLYRATTNGADRTFVEVGHAGEINSLIRRLRFAVAAASIDPHGVERIEMAAAELHQLLFADLQFEEGEELSVRPGQHLISVPWRLLSSTQGRRIVPRIGTSRPVPGRVEAPRRVLAVACTDPAGHAISEALAVAGHYPEARLLIGAEGTPDAFLDACAGNDVVHIAGYQALVQRERLVTTLLLDGGQVTMFDLGQIPSVPPIVVVASSRVTALHSRTHDVNLALTQTLIARGAREVVVSPVDLAPEHAMVVMPELHELLASGLSATEALDAMSFEDESVQLAADCLVCIEAESPMELA